MRSYKTKITWVQYLNIPNKFKKELHFSMIKNEE
jgi:hypothetical protein